MVGTASVDSMRAAPFVIGDYEVLTTLGTGGMGRVYLARKIVVADVFREYAVKLVRLEDEASDFHRVLLEEAKLAAQIRHPNVVSVVEVGDCEHGVYLVMDYVEGVNLAILTRLCSEANRELPLRVAARVMHDALAGLHAAHELRDASGELLQLVHRDFSPQNLIVGSDGATRLVDFGIAKARSRAETTAVGQVKGKVGYMAPEQALGQGLDRRADVWAAGVVAWEAISGKRLFQGDTDAETILRIVSDPHIPALYQERGDLPLEVHEAVVSAIMTDRERRCPSAGELRRRLEAAWRAGDDIGSREEVADFVRDVAHDKLEKSRRHIAEATRKAIDALEHREETKAAMAAPARGSSRRGAFATLLLLLLVGGAGAFAYKRGVFDQALASPQRAQGGLVPELDIKPPAPPPPASESAPTPPPAAPGVLTVRANVELREVWLDDKQLLLSSPSKEVRVQLPENASGATVVRVVARDGRRAEQSVSAGESEVTFELGPQPPTVRKSDDRLLPYRPSK